MARFSQGLLQGLMQPAFGQNLYEVGRAAAAGPAMTRASQRMKEEREQTQRGVTGGLFGLEQTVAEGRDYQDALGSLVGLGATPEQIAQAEQRGQVKRQATIAQEQLETKERNRQALEDRAVSIAQERGNNRMVAALKGADTKFIRDYLASKPEQAEIGLTITEWQNNAGQIVEKTVQGKDGKTRRLGDNTLMSTQDLEGLSIRSKPATTVNVSSTQETQLAKDLGGALANEVTTANALATEAESNLSLIAEARIIANDNPNIFGAGANTLDGARRATQQAMTLLGVPQEDPMYQKIANATTASGVINAFTQDFVRSRLQATKGAISNREFEAFIASVPNLLSTAEGYDKLLTYMESANTRQILRASALSKAGADSKKIQAAKNNWSKFIRDFPATAFIPSNDVEKMWRLYESGEGKKENMTFVTSVIDSEGKTTAPKRITYKEIEGLAKKAGMPPMLFLRRLYLDNNTDISFVMPY